MTLQIPNIIQELNDSEVTRQQVGKCSCGGQILAYRIPNRLDGDILPLLQTFGDPAFDFEKSHLLKIENPLYIITGVKRLREVRFTAKTQQGADLVSQFETQLEEYVKSKRE